MNPVHPSPVLIVGSMAFDDLELPSGEFENVVGGAATYSALATTLFTKARLVAVVGDDFPASVLEDLEQRGSDTGGVQRAPGKTFRWRGRYAANLASRETLDTQLNVFADFQPHLPAHYKKTPYVLLGNIHPELQARVLDQLDETRLVAADTMNYWITSERPALTRLLSRVDTLIINDEELRQLAEDHNLKRGAQRVLKMGPTRLVVKRGDAGAMLFDGDQVFFAPALPLQDEVDPTGAGDTFAGAVVGYLAREGSLAPNVLRQALLIGAATASFCVEGVGNTRLRNLTAGAIASRLDELKQMLLC